MTLSQQVLPILVLTAFLFLGLKADSQSRSGCAPHTFSTGQYDISCRCNATYCDKIVFDWPKVGEILVVESNRLGKRFVSRTIAEKNEAGAFIDVKGAAQGERLTIQLSPKNKLQTILGFGGAFTDATGINLISMKKELRESILQQYYGKDGLMYTMGRVTISGSDFSVRNYTYDDIGANEEDFKLIKFKLQKEDLKYKIPLILEAEKMLKRSFNDKYKLRLYGSSWSAPAWMKDNNSLIRGHLKGNSTGPYYKALARYLVRFLKEYEKRGVKFWGITSQNEPVAAHSLGYNFNSLIFEPDQLNAFVRDNLGPELVWNGYKRDKFNLIIYDDNLGDMLNYAKKFALDNKTMEFVSGVGIHWYQHTSVPYNRLDEVRKILPPSKYILSTEACHEGGTRPGSWAHGDEYAYDIIQTLRHGVVGWVEWNLALTMIGGPNWVKNYVDSPILFDGETYYKNPMYYVLAHFTRFLEPEAQVFESELLSDSNHKNNIANNNNNNIKQLSPPSLNIAGNDQNGDIYVIAAERPNKSHYSLVILNRGSQEKFVNVKLDQQSILQNLSIKSNSVTTVSIPTKNSNINDRDDIFILE